MRKEKVSKLKSKRNGKTGIRINNSRIKGKGFQLTRRQIFLIVIMLFIFMGSGIGYVWSNFTRTQIGYDLSRLKKEELTLMNRNQELRLELAYLKSTDRLEKKAINRMRLKLPSPDQIIVLQ